MADKSKVDELVTRCEKIQQTGTPGDKEKKYIALVLMPVINALPADDQHDFYCQLILRQVKPPQAPAWMSFKEIDLIYG